MSLISDILRESSIRNQEIGQENDHLPSEAQAVEILSSMGIDGDLNALNGDRNYFRSARHWRDWAIMSWELGINPMTAMRMEFPSLKNSEWRHIQYVLHAWRTWEIE